MLLKVVVCIGYFRDILLYFFYRNIRNADSLSKKSGSSLGLGRENTGWTGMEPKKNTQRLMGSGCQKNIQVSLKGLLLAKCADSLNMKKNIDCDWLWKEETFTFLNLRGTI